MIDENVDSMYEILLNDCKKNPDDINKFEKMIMFVNEHSVFFDSKLFIEIFKLISDEKKILYLKMLLNSCNVTKTFSLFEIKLLVNIIKNNEYKISFASLLLSSVFFPMVNVTELPDFIGCFSKNKNLILDLLFDNNRINKINNYEIYDLFMLIKDDFEKKEMLFYLRNKIPDVLDDGTLLLLIQGFDSNDILFIFEKLVIDNEFFDEELLFRCFDIENDANLTFSLLNLYIKDRMTKYDSVKKKELFLRMKRYIIDFGDYFCEEYPDGNVLYSEINKLTCLEYGLNLDNFEKIVGFFGYEVVNYLDCINIRKLINLDNENFMSVLNLFGSKFTSLKLHTLNNVLNAFYNREFLLENEQVCTIFAEFEKNINEQNKLEIVKKLKLISEKIDLKKILSNKNIDFDMFIDKLLLFDNGSINILHQITNEYITFCREHFVASKIANSHLELILDEKIEKNLAKKLFFKNFDINKIIEILSRINKNKLSKEQLELLNNIDLLTKVILYKISPNSEDYDKDFYIALSHLEKMVNILWEDGKINFEYELNLKYVYFPKQVDNNDLLGILSELDIDQLLKTILNDKVLYDKLCVFLERYQLFGWGRTFDLLSKKIDLKIDDSILAAFVNYFNVIYNECKKNNVFGLTKLLVYADCFSSVSNKFAYLFGEEDYRLICANDGNYKAPAPKNKRLELAVLHLREMYEKKTITIPSYEKKYVLKNGKTINVVVGNSTCIKNLTVGERTDSCFRICGIFYDLFKFVIKDKNGFNICFYDDEDNFVSRVSGIRNGNTIFLNQLRNSVDYKIKNEELYEVITMVCDDLLTITEKSSVPIDNVVISTQEALSFLDGKTQYIGEDVFKNSLYKLPFNYDNDGYALLMASRVAGEYVRKEIVTDLPEYICCSDKVNFYDDYESANNKFVQFCLINQLLNGKNIDELSIPSDKIKTCISTDKFIIVTDMNDKTITLILDKYKDDIEVLKRIEEISNDFSNKKLKVK